MKRVFALLLVAALLAVSAGGQTWASSSVSEPLAPAATGMPQGASGADVPFTNNGANRPVLETLTPAGQTVPIDPKAADAVHGPDTTSGTQPEVHKKGLPQFDPSTFVRQIFWLIIVFIALYVVNVRKVLPAISSVIENRRERIASDLRSAEDLKNQVATVRSEYEAAVAAAQAQAQQVILDLQTDMKKQAEHQDADFKVRSQKAIDDVEARLETSRARITNELSNIAADLTRDITKAVSGISIDDKTAQRAVDDIQGKQEAA